LVTFPARVNLNLPKIKSYSAKSEYELIDLSPDSWAGLVSRWENNEDKRGFQKYFSNYYHKSQQNKCEGECRASFICEIQGIFCQLICPFLGVNIQLLQKTKIRFLNSAIITQSDYYFIKKRFFSRLKYDLFQDLVVASGA